MQDYISLKKRSNKIEEYSKALEKDYLDLAKEAIHLLFNNTYMLWEEYKKAKGTEEGMNIYAEFWVDFARDAFNATLTKLEIKEVPDLQTFGKILKYMMSKAPSIYEIVVDKPDLHVGHVLWCANPGMNVFPRQGYNTGSYLRAEGFITPPYLNSYLEEAKKHGLDKDFVIGCNAAMCVDCSKACCQYVVYKANAKIPKFPELSKSFLYDEIGTEDPLPYILKRLNRSVEQQAADSISGVPFVDYVGWQQMFKQKINDFAYPSLWKGHFKRWWENALIDLRIAPPSCLYELGRVFIHCMKRRFTPYSMKTNTDTCIQLVNTINPFIDEAPDQLPVQYVKDIIQTEYEIINEMIRYSDIRRPISVEFLSHRLRGDSQTCIEIKYR